MRNLMRKFCRTILFFGIFLSLFFTGCGTPIYRQGNLTRGVFETGTPENFSGFGKEMPSHSSVKSFSLSFDFSTTQEMKMKNVENQKLKLSDYDPLYSGSENDYTILSKTKIKDFRYKRNRIPVAVSFTHLFNEYDFAWGYSLGLDPGLYGRFVFGVNRKNFEIGAYIDLGLVDFSDVSFNYYECMGPTYGANACNEFSGEKHLEKDDVWQTRLGGGIYVTFFWNGFAFTYAPLLYMPIYDNEFNVEKTDTTKGDDVLHIRVSYPFVLSQYLGISKWLNEHWKLSVGGMIQSSVYFNDVYLTANSSLGYWF